MLHIPAGCSFYSYRCLSRWQAQDMQSQDSACCGVLPSTGLFLSGELCEHTVHGKEDCSSALPWFGTFSMAFSDSEVPKTRGDEHPLWGTPVKSAVGPPGFGAQPERFHKLLTPPFLHPCQRFWVPFSQPLMYALMVTKTIQEYTLSICMHWFMIIMHCALFTYSHPFYHKGLECLLIKYTINLR